MEIGVCVFVCVYGMRTCAVLHSPCVSVNTSLFSEKLVTGPQLLTTL